MMMRVTLFSRPFMIGLVVLMLVLGGLLVRPVEAQAGFGSSPGSPMATTFACRGEHLPEIVVE